MTPLERAAHEFLDRKRFAVAGVSRKGDTVANVIYRKLRDSGRTVFAVNPNAETVEGDACHPTLGEIPGGVDAVVVATTDAVAPGIVAECIRLGIGHVWIHGSFGGKTKAAEATASAREAGLRFIPGSCPMMFCDPVDPAHRCMRWLRRLTGSEARPAG